MCVALVSSHRTVLLLLYSYFLLLFAPGNLSWSRLGCPETTVSAAWICLVIVSRTRPDGFPPILSINGLPVLRKPATHIVIQDQTHTQSLKLPLRSKLLASVIYKVYNKLTSCSKPKTALVPPKCFKNLPWAHFFPKITLKCNRTEWHLTQRSSLAKMR